MNNSKNEVYKLSIPSIHCQGCIETLTKALKKMSGVKEINSSAENKTITIKVQKNTVSIGQIEKTIKINGHKLRSMNYVSED